MDTNDIFISNIVFKIMPNDKAIQKRNMQNGPSTKQGKVGVA